MSYISNAALKGTRQLSKVILRSPQVFENYVVGRGQLTVKDAFTQAGKELAPKAGSAIERYLAVALLRLQASGVVIGKAAQALYRNTSEILSKLLKKGVNLNQLDIKKTDPNQLDLFSGAAQAVNKATVA